MRSRYLVVVLALFAVCVLLPVVIVRSCNFHTPPQITDPGPVGPLVSLRVAATSAIERIELEEYIKGVVAAEMPAAFGLEALKAQAVLARTYIVTRMRAFGGPGDPEHSEADISDDPARGQAWLGEPALRDRWGLSYSTYWRRIEQAVAETAGLMAVYQGEPIQAAYHSTCGGRTESSGEVWQTGLPYLQSVACGADMHSPHSLRQTTLTWRQVETALGPDAGALAVAAAAGRSGIIQILSHTAGGRVAAVQVGDVTATGVALRGALGLPSADFTVAQSSNGVTFTTRGFGHGVGLCQYGADGLAGRGLTFEQIIAHYMPGVVVRPIFSR